MKVRPRHAGKLVTVVIEDTHLLAGPASRGELVVRPRTNTAPITRIYVRGMGTQTDGESMKS